MHDQWICVDILLNIFSFLLTPKLFCPEGDQKKWWDRWCFNWSQCLCWSFWWRHWRRNSNRRRYHPQPQSATLCIYQEILPTLCQRLHEGVSDRVGSLNLAYRHAHVTECSLCTISIKSHLEEHNPERVADFMKGALGAIKRITSDFDNFQVATEFWPASHF